MAILRTLLLPKDAHAPRDPTNCFADNPDAAALGKKLFFDPRFSGMLTEGDNDGSPNTLGKKGKTQKVSCAGCHVPDSAFTDTRSPGGQISLAAGWGHRKAISLLDVAQNKLLFWDGRKDSFQSQIFTVIESPVEMNSSRLFVTQQACAGIFVKSRFQLSFA